MTVFSYSEAKQHFAEVLDTANIEGEVMIRRKDGQVFILKPEPKKKSALAVKGVAPFLTTEEIIDCVRESRAGYNE